MIKIISDSSSNVFEVADANYTTVPLKIITSEKEYIDKEGVDVREMVDFLLQTKEKSSTACPNIAEWLEAFDKDNDNIAITISSNLSGSYNAAMQAKELFEEENDHKVEVIDSHSTGPEMELHIEMMAKLISEGLDLKTLKDRIDDYLKHTNVFFLTSSVKNLANNGRIARFLCTVVDVLKLSMVGARTSDGRIEIINKCRTSKKACQKIFEEMLNKGYQGGKVRIAHCFNEKGTKYFHDLIKEKFPDADIKERLCTALDSYYVEHEGIIIAYDY